MDVTRSVLALSAPILFFAPKSLTTIHRCFTSLCGRFAL
jgi:hypothetical protein